MMFFRLFHSRASTATPSFADIIKNILTFRSGSPATIMALERSVRTPLPPEYQRVLSELAAGEIWHDGLQKTGHMDQVRKELASIEQAIKIATPEQATARNKISSIISTSGNPLAAFCAFIILSKRHNMQPEEVAPLVNGIVEKVGLAKLHPAEIHRPPQ